MGEKESRRDIFTFIEALEVSGTPFSYLPVIIPHAKGDQDTTPTPLRLKDNHLTTAYRVKTSINLFENARLE